MEPLAEAEDSENGDAAHSRTAFHKPVIETAKEQDDSEYGDAAHSRAALHRPAASSTREDAENTVRASHIRRTANAA